MRRIIIDISMTILMPLLMAYALVGEMFHEIAGTAAFVLFILHLHKNSGWFRVLGKGKYTPARVFRTIVNFLLAIFMFLQPVSGILMSKHVYTFIDFTRGVSKWRNIHLFCAYWGLVLVCVHGGTHLVSLGAKLRKGKKPFLYAVRAVAAILCGYGAYAFIKRGFWEYMILKQTFAFFDFGEPKAAFFVDYAAIMILFGIVGYLLIKQLNDISKT